MFSKNDKLNKNLVYLLLDAAYIKVLTPWGLVMPFGSIDLVNIGSGNEFLPDGTKPLPEPMLNNNE